MKNQFILHTYVIKIYSLDFEVCTAFKTAGIKVPTFQKQIFMFSFEQKKNKNENKMGQIKKNEGILLY